MDEIARYSKDTAETLFNIGMINWNLQTFFSWKSSIEKKCGYI